MYQECQLFGKVIKLEDYRVLVNDDKIKEKWRSYFHKLFSVNHIGEDW